MDYIDKVKQKLNAKTSTFCSAEIDYIEYSTTRDRIIPLDKMYKLFYI